VIALHNATAEVAAKAYDNASYWLHCAGYKDGMILNYRSLYATEDPPAPTESTLQILELLRDHTDPFGEQPPFGKMKFTVKDNT